MRLILAGLISAALHAQNPAAVQAIAELRAKVQIAPPLPLHATAFTLPATVELGKVSAAAVDSKGLIYLLQRGDKADPVQVVDRDGKVLRSWGKGLYQIPHSIRVDPAGNIWTVDAQSSVIFEFTPQGKQLLRIDVGGQPKTTNPFCGTTDIAFAPNGHLFISDGYGNARILEYTADGKRLNEWGTKGKGPGEFNLPHGIAIDEKGIVYVADRENGRIQRFTSGGKFVDEWPGLGKAFSVRLSGGAAWAGLQPAKVANGSSGWLVKLDRETGKITGYADSNGGHHLIEITNNGEIITGVGDTGIQWFRH